jgi:nucleoid-associated protein YgaU
MTRETKIGLLVGLAFIIVIGILLSDHLTSATEPQQAQLAQVAGNVRNGVAVPGGAQQQQAAPPITQVAAPANVIPQQTVPTKEELAPKQPPVEIVKIGGPAATAPQPQPTNTQVAEAAKPQATPEPPITVVDATSPTPVKVVDPSTNPLARVAEAFKEQLVAVGPDGLPQPARLEPQPTKPVIAAAALPPGARQYKAGPGDSVSRLAAKFLGADTKTNRDAILACNPTLQKNPNIIVMGRTYVIPAAPSASAAPADPAKAQAAPIITPAVETVQAPVAPIVPATPATPAPAPVADADADTRGESFYVVKAGDSLTKIAVEQLGSAAGVPAIVDLNKETLKGRDIIRPNMKLRMPAKLAMAN